MMEKHHISEADLLLDEDKLILSYLEKATESEFHLSTEIKEIQHVFEHISKKAKAIDLTLENFVNGESHKMVKAVENIEAKLRKSLKHKEETNIQQVKTLRSKLFPAHGLQERTDSFLQYLVSEDKSLLDTLTKILDPLDKTFLFVYL
ncbi:MAG: bacillithiol biosynthesis BshC [Saprospiraceae bacterium]|nr:bacillithiol biosynthesis BshC [Saprospiraceae bacterium]